MTRQLLLFLALAFLVLFASFLPVESPNKLVPKGFSLGPSVDTALLFPHSNPCAG